MTWTHVSWISALCSVCFHLAREGSRCGTIDWSNIEELTAENRLA
jgi:hypothetical protein